MSKKIHDLSDEEFDDLFRQSAEKTNIGFNSDAWNKMNQKLDAATTPPPSAPASGNLLKKWRFPIVIMLLLLIGSAYFLLKKPTVAIAVTKVKAKTTLLKSSGSSTEKYVTTDKVNTQNKTSIKKPAIHNTVAANAKSPANASASDSKPAKELLITNKESLAKKEKVIQEKHPQNKPNDTKSVSEKNGKTAIIQATKKVRDTKITYASREANEIKVANNELKSERQRSELYTAGTTFKTNSTTVKSDNSNSANAITESVNTIQNQSLTSLDSISSEERFQWAPIHALLPNKHFYAINLQLPAINVEPEFHTTFNQVQKNTAFKRGLNIRLALSPDLSFIETNNFAKIGNNWAAILEYRFNNRLSVQTGVIRSLKLYNALPYQYEWSDYFSMLQTPLKDINATCKMLDIPLNLRYDISQKPNNRWFVAAGFTSYIMLKETYNYNYENPYDPNIKRKGWEGQTGAYPFSVLNLSAGYEHRILKRLTFQAEPFFKMPLGKVGYGKVRLATAGVFFSVKYPF